MGPEAEEPLADRPNTVDPEKKRKLFAYLATGLAVVVLLLLLFTSLHLFAGPEVTEKTDQEVAETESNAEIPAPTEEKPQEEPGLTTGGDERSPAASEPVSLLRYWDGETTFGIDSLRRDFTVPGALYEIDYDLEDSRMAPGDDFAARADGNAEEAATNEETTLHLRAEIISRSWLRIEADQQTVFEGTLAPGEVKEWEAEEKIHIRTGNAGGILLRLNDVELGPMGDEGQVLEEMLTASDIES